MKPLTSTSGFTLIELMVTVALMGLVAMGMLSAMEENSTSWRTTPRCDFARRSDVS